MTLEEILIAARKEWDRGQIYLCLETHQAKAIRDAGYVHRDECKPDGLSVSSSQAPASRSTFERELAGLINKYSLENESDTPDFILAKYVCATIDAFNCAVVARDGWYDVDLHPGCGAAARLASIDSEGEGDE